MVLVAGEMAMMGVVLINGLLCVVEVGTLGVAEGSIEDASCVRLDDDGWPDGRLIAENLEV